LSPSNVSNLHDCRHLGLTQRRACRPFFDSFSYTTCEDLSRVRTCCRGASTGSQHIWLECDDTTENKSRIL